MNYPGITSLVHVDEYGVTDTTELRIPGDSSIYGATKVKRQSVS